jgi:O-antigen/teichoic acid export membrane protein
LVGVFIIVALNNSAAMLDFGLFLGIKAMGRDMTAEIIGLFGVYVALNLQSQVYSALYRYSGGYARFNYAANSTRLLELLSTIGLLLANASEKTVVLGMCVTRAVALLVYHIDSRRIRSSMPIGVRKATIPCFHSLVLPGLGLFTTGVAQTIQNQGIAIVLNRQLGAEAVLSFAVGRTLSRIPSQLISLVNSTVAPEFSVAVRSHSTSTARKMHRLTMQVSLALSIVTLFVTIAIGPWIIEKWLSSQVSIPRTLLFALNIGIMLNLFWYSSSVVLNATNNNSGFGAIYLVTSVCVILLLSVLPRSAPLESFVLVSAVTELIVGIYVVPKACVIVHDSFPEAARSCMSFSEARAECRVLAQRIRESWSALC